MKTKVDINTMSRRELIQELEWLMGDCFIGGFSMPAALTACLVYSGTRNVDAYGNGLIRLWQQAWLYARSGSARDIAESAVDNMSLGDVEDLLNFLSRLLSGYEYVQLDCTGAKMMPFWQKRRSYRPSEVCH